MPGQVMSAEEYTGALDILTATVRTLLLIPTDQMLNTLTRIDTIAPIIDPTAYRKGMGNLDDQRRLIKAAEGLRQVAVDIREREGVSP